MYQQMAARKRERSGTLKLSPQPDLPDAVQLDVARLVARIAPNPRRALVLHDVVGLSVAEIAAEIDHVHFPAGRSGLLRCEDLL